MSYLNVTFYSLAISRQTTFAMFIPSDVPPEMIAGNKAYDRPMKTLFLLHGFSGNFMDWSLGSLTQELAMKHNLAIVMPSGDNSFYLDQKGVGNNYESFIAVDLPEYVRKTFGLAMKPEDTLIGGLSMGGYGALHAALCHPETFGGMFGLSSALIVNGIKGMKPGEKTDIADYDYYERIFGDLNQLEENPCNPEYVVEQRLAKGEKIQPIYMACGSEDFLVKENYEFRDFLRAHQVEVQYEEGPGIHDWVFWNQYLDPAVSYLLGCM